MSFYGLLILQKTNFKLASKWFVTLRKRRLLLQSSFLMISVPVGTDDIPFGMISASQMIYASRMMGTDIISYKAHNAVAVTGDKNLIIAPSHHFFHAA